MQVHSISPYHAISMNTGEQRKFTNYSSLAKSDVLNDCDQVIAVRDLRGNLLEVDFTPSGRNAYLTGNVISAITDRGIIFNASV